MLRCLLACRIRLCRHSFPFLICPHRNLFISTLGSISFGGGYGSVAFRIEVNIFPWHIREATRRPGTHFRATSTRAFAHSPSQNGKEIHKENNFSTCVSPINNSFIFTKTNYTHYLSERGWSTDTTTTFLLHLVCRCSHFMPTMSGCSISQCDFRK